MDAAGLLADLDERQRAAVTTPSTLVAVIASAGSGKTRVLTRRIAYRVAVGTADARHTLALTFTREAAGELRRRLRRSGLRDFVEAGTFHAMALGVLQQRWTDTNRPIPTIVADRERLFGELVDPGSIADIGAERTWAAARGIAPESYAIEAKAANRRRSMPAARVGDALAAYETLKRRRGVIDLDDLLLMLSHELDRDPAFAEATRWRYRHVLVDEAQDLNPMQYRLLRQILGDNRDLFLVGDPAQSIYGFNGSDPTLLSHVDRHLPGVEIVRLPTNHRCSPQIVSAGMHVLGSVGHDAGAVASRADGMAVLLIEADDEYDEAAAIVRFAQSLDHSRVQAGAFAVLARTHQQLLRLDGALSDAGLPVRRRLLAPGTPLAKTVRAVGLLASASQLRAWAHDVLDAAPIVTPAPLQDEMTTAERRVAAAVLEFLREQPLGNGVGLRSWLASNNPFIELAESTGIELLTFHAAKGREWPIVVVAGVETGLVPHRSAGTVDARAEEARLLHVAFTRAGDQLVVTRASRRGGYARQPSPFVVGLDTSDAPTVGPPPELAPPTDERVSVTRRRSVSLQAWRDHAAKAADMLPEQICSGADLAAIARTPPASAADLSAITGFGPLTAARLYPPIKAALDAVGAGV